MSRKSRKSKKLDSIQRQPLSQYGSKKNWYLSYGEDVSENINVNVHGFPEWFFPGVLRMDFSQTIRCKDISVQKFSMTPRHWFIDAYFRCEKCKKEFCWTAEEQQYWFDDLHFYVGAYPKLCPQCSITRRTIFHLDAYYGANIQAAIRRDAPLKLKRQMLAALGKLEWLSEIPLSAKKQESCEILKKQIAKLTTSEK